MVDETGFLGGLDYDLCDRGTAHRVFRGPLREPEPGHVVFLGGAETFGHFVRTPFPELTGRNLGVPVLNLGCVNGGLDTFCGNPPLLEACQGAVACVVQDMSPATLSNPYYVVDRRRNDRLLAPTSLLQELYPELDFSGFRFVRHLLETLAGEGDDRFVHVCRTLGETWTQRMTLLLGALPAPCVLLRLPTAVVPRAVNFAGASRIGAIRPRLAGVVSVAMPKPDWTSRTDGMVFAPLERLAARALPTPDGHSVIAAEVTAALRMVLPKRVR